MTVRRPPRLIVNADDFGYFDGVCRGILEAAGCGAVTATGVMANGPALERWVDELKRMPGVSAGVHLNATLGRPLTPGMSRHLAGGAFPAKGGLASAILLGRLPRQLLLDEWRTQIRRCLDHGLRIEFVNSHEHVHVLPGLYSRVCALAGEFGIRQVRPPAPEFLPRVTAGGVLRSLVMAAARTLAPPPRPESPAPIGLNPSGRLDLGYCRWRLARLAPGGAYELMCHPGREDPVACGDPRLRAYHDWEGELALLTGGAFRDLLRSHGVELVSFASLARPRDEEVVDVARG